jgi:flagellar hook-associated protein 3 FlgL
MTVQSISNLVQNKSLLSDINATKTKLAKGQKQISSGRSVENYLDLINSGSVIGEINLEDRISLINSYITSNNVVSNRLDATDLSLENIINELTNFRNAIMQRRSAVGTMDEIKSVINEIGRATLANIRDYLNIQYEGQYMFAGGRVNVEPVDNIVLQTNILNGEVTANYYRGDAINRTAGVSDSLTIEYSLKADDESFQKGIGSINRIITSADDADVEAALGLVNEAISGIVNLRSKVGNSMRQVDSANEVHESTKSYFTAALSDLVSAKVDEVMIKISNDTAILYGSYQVFSILSKLNLADYLR